MEKPAPSILKADHLKKIYRKRAVVNGASFSLQQGEIVGLLGANGAGKSTSFYMLVGFIEPDEGKILFNDQDITKLAMHERASLGISYLPQEASIFRKMTVENNLLAILETRSLTQEQRSKKLEKLLDDFSIQHIRKNYGYALSGGERRRVEIARCLATDPIFLLLDEPFAGVDPLVVLDIQKMIRYLVTLNIGILINDHNIRETLGITQRAYIMNKGEIIISGTPKEIINNELAKKVYFGENFSF